MPVEGVLQSALSESISKSACVFPSNLQRRTEGRGTGTVPPEVIKTVEQGAATSVLLATSPLLAGVGGRYFADCNETEVVDRRTGTLHGVARYAVDPGNARRLWELSEELLADAG
jgi:hypothetical protein